MHYDERIMYQKFLVPHGMTKTLIEQVKKQLCYAYCFICQKKLKESLL